MAALLVALLVAAAVFTLLWTQQRRLMYFPDPNVPPPDAVELGRVEEVSFPTGDGLTLRGWFLPAERPALPGEGASRAATVVVFNGNGGNRAYRAPLADALCARGFNVLLFDYRGYGGNPGAPSEGGLHRDSLAARHYLLARPDVDPSRLVYFGESLGTGVAVHLAAEHPPAALILRSPFTSFADVGAHHYRVLPVRWLLRDRYESARRIAAVRAPILVIAGDRDTIVPTAHSRRLFELAPEPRRWLLIHGADHNDSALLAGPEMVEAVAEFLQRV